MKKRPTLSIVIPVLNEEENLTLLYSKLKLVLVKMQIDYEIIFIDDGSTDGSFSVLTKIYRRDKRIKVIKFRRNFGQTAAIAAGFSQAKGKIIVTMDSDLQNDPNDIPNLLDKINQGYDLVSGWRRGRKDPLFSRKIPSFLANRLISYFTGVRLHDYGCTLKAYRREVIENINLYGEMHRFIPALASWIGASITEVPVTHHARRYGRSKYSFSRAVKVVLDLLTVKFLVSYQTKPIYFFGNIGFLLLLAGFLSALVTGVEKVFYGAWVHRNPMFMLMVLFWIVGIQFIMMGLLAEISIRTYHESQKKPTYFTDRILG